MLFRVCCALLTMGACATYSTEPSRPVEADASVPPIPIPIPMPEAGSDVVVLPPKPDAAVDASVACGTLLDAGASPALSGIVCGVGACRKNVAGCGLKSADECPAQYGTEISGNGVDDNCDGIIDEGTNMSTAKAGIKCTGCLTGFDVRREADGGVVGDLEYQNRRNAPECVNSALCGTGGPQWIRMSNGSPTCDDACGKYGRTCSNACSVSSAAGAKNRCNFDQANIGGYFADVSCTFPNGMSATGSCSAPSLGSASVTTFNNNAYNLYCCCNL
jgi:hypothetical protein